MARPTGASLTVSACAYRAVAADSGAIGGDVSEEFQVIAATGEDAIVYCPTSDYAANMEKATAPWHRKVRPPEICPGSYGKTPLRVKHLRRTWLPLGVPLQTTVKSLVLAPMRRTRQGRSPNHQVWLLLLRGDHDMNEIKVGKLPGLEAFRFATAARSRPTLAASPAIWARSDSNNRSRSWPTATWPSWPTGFAGANEEDSTSAA